MKTKNETIPAFRAVDSAREWKAVVAEKTQGFSVEEKLRFFRQAGAEARKHRKTPAKRP
jgi:hypothetical protein